MEPKPQRAHATIAAARAEEMAAKASIATADAIKKNSRYLLAAVIVAAISAGGRSLLLLLERREKTVVGRPTVHGIDVLAQTPCPE